MDSGVVVELMVAGELVVPRRGRYRQRGGYGWQRRNGARYQ